MYKYLIFTLICIIGLLSNSKASDIWPEKYVRSTNTQVWNIIVKRCKTQHCLNHLKNLKRIQQNIGSNGCGELKYLSTTKDERVAKCGTADSKSVSGGSTSSPVDRVWSLPPPKRSKKVTGNYRKDFRLRDNGQTW